MKKLLLILSLIFVSQISFSQTHTLQDTTNSFIMDRVFENDTNGLLWWLCDSMHENVLFTEHKSHTGLGINDTMILVKTYKDSFIGLSHNEYQQFYRDLEVQHATYKEHFQDDGQVIMSSGWIVEDLDLTASATKTEAQALEIALDSIGSDTFAWEDDTLEFYLKEDYLDSIATDSTYYPKGVLMYALTGDFKIIEDNYKLAWRFHVVSKSPYRIDNIYIDATNGDLIRIEDAIEKGTFNHIFYGNQYIDDRWISGFNRNKYYLQANDANQYTSGQKNIKTKHTNIYNSYKPTRLPSNTTSNWGNSHWPATSCHYVTQVAWEFWDYQYHRNGPNNNGSGIRVRADVDLREVITNKKVRAVTFYHSPIRGTDYFDFSRNDTSDLPATYDIGGHEFGHAINAWNQKLVASHEHGAILESFGDIIGFMVERYATGSYTWTLGEDADWTIRDLSDPSEYDNPNWRYHDNWEEPSGCNATKANDNCYVHTNCGVQNKWFHLLSVGGTQNGYTVTGIGIDKAALIAMYAFILEINPTETYDEIRSHTIAAARKIYGICSYEVLQTCLAWSACNIGSPCTCDPEFDPDICWDDDIGVSEGQEPVNVNKDHDDYFRLIRAYPNPVTETINISINEYPQLFRNSLNLLIEITDVNGKLVKSHEILNGNNTQINMSEFVSGVYFLKITSGQLQKRLKVIKL